MKSHRGRAAVTGMPFIRQTFDNDSLRVSARGKEDKSAPEAGKPPLLFSVACADQATALLLHTRDPTARPRLEIAHVAITYDCFFSFHQPLG